MVKALPIFATALITTFLWKQHKVDKIWRWVKFTIAVHSRVQVITHYVWHFQSMSTIKPVNTRLPCLIISSFDMKLLMERNPCKVLHFLPRPGNCIIFVPQSSLGTSSENTFENPKSTIRQTQTSAHAALWDPITTAERESSEFGSTDTTLGSVVKSLCVFLCVVYVLTIW